MEGFSLSCGHQGGRAPGDEWLQTTAINGLQRGGWEPHPEHSLTEDIVVSVAVDLSWFFLKEFLKPGLLCTDSV